MPPKKGSETVKVMVRCRPMNSRENKLNCTNVTEVNEKTGEIIIRHPEDPEKVRSFTYDAVFGIESLQTSVYETTTFGIVEAVFSGYNGTVFAYGQTGCGKTFSMMGVQGNEVLKGIIPRTFQHILSIIHSGGEGKNYLIRVSFLEIYNECVQDLLGVDTKRKLKLKEHPKKGIYVEDLTMKAVKTEEEMYKWMQKGDSHRTVGATKMNAGSSRSHSIFQIYVETGEDLGNGQQKFTSSKLNMVDLAGSERQSKTEATGARLKEAQKINLSLTSLGNVIQALVDGKSKHIPYRNSKLTRLLQDSLGGNTKTVMIAAISPASDNYDETLSTLRYASRAKNIKNKPKVNMDPKDALLAQYAEEIKKLKDQLKHQGGGGMSMAINEEDLLNVNKLKEMEERNSKLKDREAKMKQNLQMKEKLVEEERKRQKELEKMLNEFASKQQKSVLLRSSSINVEAEKKNREEMLQRENQREAQMNKRRQQDENIEEGEAPRQLGVLKEQYRRLYKKIKQKELELQDLDSEHIDEKFDYFDQIKDQKKEIKFLTNVIDMLVFPEELDRVRLKSNWNDVANCFDTPGFLLNNKKVSLPKVPKKKIIGAWEDMKQHRALIFKTSRSKGRYSNESDEKDDFDFDADGFGKSGMGNGRYNKNLPKIEEDHESGGFGGNLRLSSRIRSDSDTRLSSGRSGPIIQPIVDRSQMESRTKGIARKNNPKNFDQFPFIDYDDNHPAEKSIPLGSFSRKNPRKKKGVKLAPIKMNINV